MAIITKLDSNGEIILDDNIKHLFPEGWRYYNLPSKGTLGGWWDPNKYDYYFWDDDKKSLILKTDDKALPPGEYFRWKKGTVVIPNSTSGTATTNTTVPISSSPFTGLNLGTPRSTATLQTTPIYNLDWYKRNKNNLEEYLKLGENYNKDIENHSLSHNLFLALLKFLNPSIYEGMDENNDGNITDEEYTLYVNQDKNKFFNKFNVTDNSWLNDLGKLYYTFFNENKGLDKIQSYNDHLRMLYGDDLTEGGKGNNEDNGDAINYLKYSPAYGDDDKYKLARAYNDAMSKGDYKTANRLSLYMTPQGITHYGNGDHFDMNHLRSRWERTIDGGNSSVGNFLDWLYEYKKNNPNVSADLINNIIRRATKYNFKLDLGFWNKLGKEANTIRDAYAIDHLPSFKQGGKIFNMLFV